MQVTSVRAIFSMVLAIVNAIECARDQHSNHSNHNNDGSAPFVAEMYTDAAYEIIGGFLDVIEQHSVVVYKETLLSL
jgi:hypothetical protein